jgi:hypothetical protein
MAKDHGFFRNLLIWSYERGTLQYDIICALILAFIFFVPRSCFAPKKTATSTATASQTVGQNPNSEKANYQTPPQKHGEFGK